LEDPGADRRIILKWIFRNWDEGAWTGLIRLRVRRDSRNLLIRNGTSGSIKYGEYVDQLRNGYLLKKNSAPWSSYVYRGYGVREHGDYIYIYIYIYI